MPTADPLYPLAAELNNLMRKDYAASLDEAVGDDDDTIAAERITAFLRERAWEFRAALGPA